jgi:hypothetical protein
LDLGRIAGGQLGRVRYAGSEWCVRRVASGAGRYRCPGCQQEFTGIAHVVVWPADGTGGLPGVEQRRHWHSKCWAARQTRPPLGSYR